jgi:hypothetical protein
LEGRPTVGIQFRKTVWLLDEEAVVRDFIEYLASDARCPFALFPKLLAWLRDQFNHTYQSVTHMLRALALIVENTLSECPFAAALCEPLDNNMSSTPQRQGRTTKHGPAEARLDRVAVETQFLDRLRESPQECKDVLLKVWADNAAPSSHASPLPTLVQVAATAAEAFLWRQQLCQSLPVWDELLCVVQPLTRHQGAFGRLKRLEHLLSMLWPQASDDAMEEQIREIEKLHEKCVKNLGLRDFVPPSAISGLLHVIEECCPLEKANASACTTLDLDPDLQWGLQKLLHQKVDEQLRKDLQQWMCKFMKVYWQPLKGQARALFLSTFACGDSGSEASIRPRVERNLGSWRASESLLLPLAQGSAQSTVADRSDDMASLFRLLECANGRSVNSAEMYEAFAKQAASAHALAEEAVASVEDSAMLQKRYSQALIALHTMGIIAPRASTCRPFWKSEKAPKSRRGPRHFDGFTLRKKCVGRVWLKRKDAPTDYISAPVVETRTAVRPAVVAEPKVLGFAARILESLPAMEDGAELKVPLWKARAAEHARRSQESPPRKRGRVVNKDKGRVRIFMT